MSWSALTRRSLLKGAAALGTAATVKPIRAWSGETKVIKVHEFWGDLTNLDPAFRLGADERIMFSIFSNLVIFKEGDQWDWELDDAESIEQVDATHVRFTLRPGILWTNGYGEVTTEDVKYSFERFIDPELEAAYKIDWELLDHVEIIDKYTGVIVLKEPFAPLWTSSLPHASGCIICKRAVEEAGGRFTTDPIATSGPYLIKEWLPKQKTVLARNPLWNGPKYDFDEIHIFPIEDFKIAELAYEAGDLDAIYVSISSVPRYQKQLPSNSKLAVKPSLNYRWLGINVEHPQYTDIRVRKAVQQAVDVDAVLEAAYFGVAERSHGFVPPGLVGYRDYNLTKYDPESARALLAEAGYPNGFKTTLHVINDTDNVTAAQVMQANLGKVGIEVEIIPEEVGSFYSLGQESEGEMWKDLQLYYNHFNLAPDASWGSAWFTCEQVGIWNWERVCNPEFDELHRKALVETDPAKRHEMYVRMQDMMEETGAYLFTTHGPNSVLHRDHVIPSLTPNGLYAYRMRHFKLA